MERKELLEWRLMNDKRGFIRILEAFISILLITGVILVVINKGYLRTSNITSEVYDVEVSILREIELDENLREIILKVPHTSLPVNWDDTDSPLGTQFPPEITKKILDRAPEYLNCISNICELDSICGMETYVEEDVYVQSVAIAANPKIYQPKQLKLFCWVK